MDLSLFRTHHRLSFPTAQQQDDLPIYAATKSYVIHFTRGVQAALMPKDGSRPSIRINAVCPAAAVTGMLQEQMKDPSRLARTEQMLKTYQITVDSLADALVLAAEEEALHGDVIRVTPKGGAETWDFIKNKRKELLFKL